MKECESVVTRILYLLIVSAFFQIAPISHELSPRKS